MPKLTREQVDDLESRLAQFNGTNGYHQFGASGRMICTDGVLYLAEQTGAFWLLELIAGLMRSDSFNRASARDPRLHEMSFWRLTVDQHGEGTYLRCRADSDARAVVSHRIEYTDFPLPQIDIWVANAYAMPKGLAWLLMLPNEY